MRTHCVQLVFVCLGLAAGCGGAPGEQSGVKIIGGTPVESIDPIAKSTWLMKPNGHVFCTGSLIEAKRVLTAAHCLKDYSDRQLYVVFGSSALARDVSRANVRSARRIVVDPEYNTEVMRAEEPLEPAHDLAMVSLADAAPEGYEPISLLDDENPVDVGEPLILAGYGLRSVTERRETGLLYRVESRIIRFLELSNELEFGETPGRSACMGDSGGPAFVVRDGKLKQIGVTSRGARRCDSTGIYTDVRKFRAWINQTSLSMG